MMLLYLVRGSRLRPAIARACWLAAGLVSVASLVLFLVAGRVREIPGDRFAQVYADTP
jgi:hypothetical protein